MHRRLLALPFLLAALAGCSSEAPAAPAPAPAPAPVSRPAATPARPAVVAPTSTALADVPSAPPIEQWVRKSSDFQQTLDLNMQTALISRLDISPSDATASAARDLAYYICTDLRGGTTTDSSAPVRELYPTAALPDAIGVSLAAQAYCLDTV